MTYTESRFWFSHTKYAFLMVKCLLVGLSCIFYVHQELLLSDLTNHSSPSNAKVKNKWSSALLPHCSFTAWSGMTFSLLICNAYFYKSMVSHPRRGCHTVLLWKFTVGHSTFLLNFGKYLTDYSVPHPRRCRVSDYSTSLSLCCRTGM
jgi:hypothetical protein